MMYNDNNNQDNCPTEKCIPQEYVIKNVRLAAAYVPIQYLCELFSPMESLCKGTVFPELYSPYVGKSKKRCPCDYR